MKHTAKKPVLEHRENLTDELSEALLRPRRGGNEHGQKTDPIRTTGTAVTTTTNTNTG